MPSARRLAISSHDWRRAAGSNPVVGSSRKISSGSPAMPSARSRRRRWPPDSAAARASARSAEADQVDHLVDGARVAGRRRVELEASRTVRVGSMPSSCRTMPMRSRNARSRWRGRGRGRALAGVGARGGPRGSRRGRLAGAVGAEDAEHLAAADVEVDAVERCASRSASAGRATAIGGAVQVASRRCRHGDFEAFVIMRKGSVARGDPSSAAGRTSPSTLGGEPIPRISPRAMTPAREGPTVQGVSW